MESMKIVVSAREMAKITGANSYSGSVQDTCKKLSQAL